MSKWQEWLSEDNMVLWAEGADSGTALVHAALKDLDFRTTEDAFRAAFRRHKNAEGLRDTISQYIRSPDVKAPKPPKLEDIRFELSGARHLEIAKSQRVVVTAALNNSDVDPLFWRSLLTYCRANKAALIVLPVRYKNPTNRVDGKIQDARSYWPDEVLPYITDEMIKIHEHFWVMGHVRIQATASTPLSGLESLSKGASACFGHGQLAMKMVPTPQNRLPKVLHTTGSVSKANYSTTKAGIKGDFHHTLSALVIEKDGPRFHLRTLLADDDGVFYDLDRKYDGSKRTAAKGCLALVTGDEHAIFADPECRQATYTGKNSIVSALKPEVIVRHDVFDGYAVNHHSAKNIVTQIAKAESSYGCVRTELQATVDHIDDTTPKGVTNFIVSSNHHDHLLQWMRERVPLDDPRNARVWHELWSLVLPSVKMGPCGAECDDPFAAWCNTRLKSDTVFIDGDSQSIAGINVAFHGHQGSNGSRGSINQFAKIGEKTIIGHSHTPGIRYGAYQVGTSSRLKLEYNRGLSSWGHCHAVIHKNGKRQLIFVIDGNWRLHD